MKNPGTKIPADILALWNKAVSCNCKGAKTALFKKWLVAGKDWMSKLGSHSEFRLIDVTCV